MSILSTVEHNLETVQRHFQAENKDAWFDWGTVGRQLIRS